MAVELRAGRLVLLTTGEYSDYSHTGTFVALVDVSSEQMQDAVNAVNAAADATGAEGLWSERHSMFQAEMIRRGWLAEVSMQEVHLGSYGYLAPESRGDA